MADGEVVFPRLSAVPPDVPQRLADVAGEITAVHVDVVDPLVVGGESSAAPLVRELAAFGLPIEVHLSGSATGHLASLAAAGATTVIVDPDQDVPATSELARSLGLRFGVLSSIASPSAALSDLLPFVDVVLVGAAADQSFTKRAVTRVAVLRELIDERGLRIELQVEGGLDTSSAPLVALAGVDTLVVGAALFGTGMPPRRAARELRRAAQGLPLTNADDDAAHRLSAFHAVERLG